MPWLAPLADLLYPPACWACGAGLDRQEEGLCGGCAPVPLGDRCRRCAEPQGPGANPPDCPTCRDRILHFRHVAALGCYGGGLMQAVRRAKFGARGAAWDWMGGALGAAVSREPWAGEIHAVVPVPSGWRSRLRRGYNPAAVLARRVAGSLGRPCRAWLLRRGRALPQVGLRRAQRLANVAGAFAVAPGARPRGLRLLLVDDVMTTGATAAACADALLRAGALSVDVAVAGR